jgi:hypothetical protein
MKIYFNKQGVVAMISENMLKAKNFEYVDYNLSQSELERIKNQEPVYYRNGRLEFEETEKEKKKKEKKKLKDKLNAGTLTDADIVDFLQKI